MKNEARNLKERKEWYVAGFGGMKGRDKWCKYVQESKQARKEI